MSPSVDTSLVARSRAPKDLSISEALAKASATTDIRANIQYIKTQAVGRINKLVDKLVEQERIIREREAMIFDLVAKIQGVGVRLSGVIPETEVEDLTDLVKRLRATTAANSAANATAYGLAMLSYMDDVAVGADRCKAALHSLASEVETAFDRSSEEAIYKIGSWRELGPIEDEVKQVLDDSTADSLPSLKEY